MIPSLLLGFALGWLSTMPLAGPVTILFLRKAATGQRRAALGLGIGAGLGEGLYVALAAFGYGFILNAFPEGRKLLADLSILVMIALGAYFMAAAAPFFEQEAHQPKGGGRLGLGLGVSMTLLNPAILFNWTAVLAMLHGKGWGPVTRPAEACFTLGVVSGILGWFIFLEGVLVRTHGKIPKKALTWTLRGLGAVLLVTGLAGLVRNLLKT